MSSEVLSNYIKKLGHPLKEIRERSLQLLIAKLELGWELDDILTGTRELLEALLSWFKLPQPTLQREALKLILMTIKTQSGTYIVKEFGINQVLMTLIQSRNKIEADALDIYVDVKDTLQFLNTLESEDNVIVPHLKLSSAPSSESGREANSIKSSSESGYCNIGADLPCSSEVSVSSVEMEPNFQKDGVKVLLFPWVELCPSDYKTMILIEDALKLLKSTRRCCRFIKDVFLRDFPAEIFLNRPTIIKSLLSLSEGVHGENPGEALSVLLSLTCALRVRLKQLCSMELVFKTRKDVPDTTESVDSVNSELEEIAGLERTDTNRGEDGLAALRQLPAPVYALDTLHAVLSIMARSVLLDNGKPLDLRELNMCLSLVESLIELLLDCVSELFWSSNHEHKTYRDIAHKSCMAMRLLGDILMRFRKSFISETEKPNNRMAWLRLTSCGEKLLTWSQNSALPPSSLVVALQAAQIDPAIVLFYPALSKRINTVLQVAKTKGDQEHKSRHRELLRLFANMDDAVKFMKNKEFCRRSKDVLQIVIKSLPLLELHLNEGYVDEVVDILLFRSKDLGFSEDDWSCARSILLKLMAHSLDWVRAKVYSMMAVMVKSVLVGAETNEALDEKCLMLIYDVGVLTEICCHGLSSDVKGVQSNASDIMLYLLRGRLVLSEGSWWRLLASLRPVFPLLHVYAEHDTVLGKAICKSLDLEIAECMGVSVNETVVGLVRLLFVRCVAVELDAAHALCRLLDDERYLPPKEALRPDIMMNSFRRIEPQDFNIDTESPTSGTTQATGLTQIMDVLKQDLKLDESGSEFVPRVSARPTLDPSLRRSTLQQLSVMLRQQELHPAFVKCDGLRVIVAILRMSLMVDDYLAFPECAISCISVINSVCFVNRHALAKIHDLPLLLIRVMLVFPANDSAVLMCAQVLSLTAWSGFALQELDSERRRVPALPLSVTERTRLPFLHNSYWKTSPNSEHSSIEWLVSDSEFRACGRVLWWCGVAGAAQALRGAGPPPAPAPLRPAPRDLALLRAACPVYCCTKALLMLENATTHSLVNEAIDILEGYTMLLPLSSSQMSEFTALPWQHCKRFLAAAPASSRDANLLISLLRYVLIYMDKVSTNDFESSSWVSSSFLDKEANMILLLSKDQVYPQQTPQDTIEVTQLHIHIVKVLRKCVVHLEQRDEYSNNKMESLLMIILACLETIDLKNFHKLGYLNELMRCIRYILYSRHTKLSEDRLLHCLRLICGTLSGCAAGGGRKGEACRMDAILSLLSVLRQIHEMNIPAQRWSEAWCDGALRALLTCAGCARAALRAAALHVLAALAHHAPLWPHLTQAISDSSLSQYAAEVFSKRCEANVVRSAAAALLTSVTSRVSSHSDVSTIIIVLLLL